MVLNKHPRDLFLQHCAGCFQIFGKCINVDLHLFSPNTQLFYIKIKFLCDSYSNTKAYHTLTVMDKLFTVYHG